MNTALIVIEAAILGLLIGYGFWLRNILRQQINTKDATIQYLKERIEGLSTEQAPAIVQKYQTMKQHAEEMTQTAQELENALKKADVRLALRDRTSPLQHLAGEGSGLIVAYTILNKFIGSQLGQLDSPDTPPPSALFLAGGYEKAVEAIFEEVEQRHKQVEAALDSM